MQKTRPTGVIILVVLEVISGIFALLAGLAFSALGAFMMFPAGGMPEFLAALVGVLGFVFIILGIVSFLLAYGLWNGRVWAWTWALIFAVIGIIIGLVQLPGSIVGIIINLIVIYYLTRAHVKTFFGK